MLRSCTILPEMAMVSSYQKDCYLHPYPPYRSWLTSSSDTKDPSLWSAKLPCCSEGAGCSGRASSSKWAGGMAHAPKWIVFCRGLSLTFPGGVRLDSTGSRVVLKWKPKRKPHGLKAPDLDANAHVIGCRFVLLPGSTGQNPKRPAGNFSCALKNLLQLHLRHKLGVKKHAARAW